MEEEYRASLDYVLGILQGQVDSITQLRSDGFHEDFADGQAIRNAILESAHVAEHLSLLRKKAISEKLNSKTNLHRTQILGSVQVNKLIEKNKEQRAGNDQLMNEIFELAEILEYVKQLKQEELDEDVRILEVMKQNNLEALGSDNTQLNQSDCVLQLAKNGPGELLWKIIMFLDGQDLLQLQLTSAHLRQWAQHNILNSTLGQRAIRQKLNQWLKKDPTTVKTAKLSCKHPVDFISFDTKEIILASNQAGLTIFNRSTLECVASLQEVLNSNMKGKVCFNSKNLVLPSGSSLNDGGKWRIVDRATLRTLLEVDAGSYRPARLNARGDILFLVNESVGEAHNEPDEYFSINFQWRDARDGGPALCFIDVDSATKSEMNLISLNCGQFMTLLLSQGAWGTIFTIDTNNIQRSEMQKELSVKIFYTIKTGYHIVDSSAGKRRLVSMVKMSSVIVGTTFREPSIVPYHGRACYRHPYMIFGSRHPLNLSSTGPYLIAANVESRCNYRLLKLHKEHKISGLAINTSGLVILSGSSMHIYAIDNEWLKEAMDRSIYVTDVIDARPAYVRTKVLTREAVNIWPVQLDSHFLAYVREDDSNNVFKNKLVNN